MINANYVDELKYISHFNLVVLRNKVHYLCKYCSKYIISENSYYVQYYPCGMQYYPFDVDQTDKFKRLLHFGVISWSPFSLQSSLSEASSALGFFLSVDPRYQ